MTTASLETESLLRIGAVAEKTGTTPRTIRYYEEIGLLATEDDRPKGGHRLYTVQDVDRVREIIRLRDLLGLSLEQLTELVKIESTRRQLKSEWAAATEPNDRRRILLAAMACADEQLALVADRQSQLAGLEREIQARRIKIQAELSNLSP